MKKLLLLFFISFLLAPAPWGIALNHQTKECAGFWAGDEYVSYKLPEGWQAYYPGNANLISTEIGSCQWSDADWDSRVEKCCQELGYAYVSSNIGERHAGFTMFSVPILCAALAACLLVLLVCTGVVVLVRISARRRGSLGKTVDSG
jgi:hypothetical protein